MHVPSRLLIVEDDASVRRLVTAVVGMEFDEVVESADGLDGFGVAQAVQPDLVLLDLDLPGLDGLEVCRRLRGLAAFQNTPIVVLTAHVSEAYLRESAEAGATDFLGKPFSPSQLRARLRTWLIRSQP